MTTTAAQSLANETWAPRFFTLRTGQALSLPGSQLVQFAIIWYLTKTTNSATVLAIASLMRAAGFFIREVMWMEEEKKEISAEHP